MEGKGVSGFEKKNLWAGARQLRGRSSVILVIQRDFLFCLLSFFSHLTYEELLSCGRCTYTPMDLVSWLWMDDAALSSHAMARDGMDPIVDEMS